jgi:RNA polymerase sigma factor (sigma-70 family)
MAVHPLGAVLQHVRKLAGARTGQNLPDGQLLHSFIAQRDDYAFSELVNRHGRLVLRVCRQVLGHEQDAEDAFQATFMVLAKKAESIRKKDSLSSWLYGVAYRTAMKAKTTAGKRNPPMNSGRPMVPCEPPKEAALLEFQTLLHEEVNRLPEKFRVPFVLCCLEGKSQAEAAEQLGWKCGTVSGRLAQARERLRHRLISRGVTLSTLLGAFALSSSNASAVVPSALADTAIRAALVFIKGEALGTISTQVLSLAESVMKAMALTKCKGGVTLALTAAMFATGVGLAAYQTFPPRPPTSAVRDLPKRVVQGNDRTNRTSPKQARFDDYGDPLPPGAIARVGTMRFRQGSQVYCVAFSTDGKLIASGSYHGDLCLWDRETGKLLRRFVDPFQDDKVRFVTAVAFSADGEILASNKGKAALWDVRSGRLLRHIDKNFSICSMAFSPDGKSLALATDDEKGIWIFDPGTGKARRAIEGHSGSVTAVTFSNGGEILASGGADKTARIWDFATGKEIRRFEPQVDPLDRRERVMDVALSSDGMLLAAQTTKEVFLWEVTTGREVHRFQAERQFWSLAFSPDGTRLASANRIWEVKTGQEICRLEGLPSSNGAFDPQGKTRVPVTGSMGGIVTGALAFAPDGKALASGGYDGVIRLHDPDTGKELLPTDNSPWNRGMMTVCGFAPDGRWLAVHDNGGIHLCETSTGREIRRLPMEDDYGVSVAFPLPVALSPDGRTVTAAGAKAIYQWDTATGDEVRRIPCSRKWEELGSTAALAFAPDGKAFACAHFEPTIRFWDTMTGKQLGQLDGDENGFLQLFFSPDGKKLVSETLNHTIQLWDLATRKELDSWSLPFGRVQAFSPDGRTVAVGGPLILCDLASGKELRRFDGIKANFCAFSPDGRLLAVDADPTYSPDRERTIQVLELASGEVRAQFAGHFGFPGQMAFSADGRMLATGSSDTTALIWDVTGQIGGVLETQLRKGSGR